MDHKEFLHIYDNLNGFCEKQDENFPDQFEADEELFRARDEIYAAKERLIEKYPDTEKDIYVITDNYEFIMRRMCEITADIVLKKIKEMN